MLIFWKWSPDGPDYLKIFKGDELATSLLETLFGKKN